MSIDFFNFCKKMLNGSANLSIAKSANIHSTVVFLGGNIVIEDDVFVGPYCVLSGDIKLSKGVSLLSHVVISGNTEIGKNTVVHPFASVGSAPQDVKYKGEKTFLVIGEGNVIREHVTISTGTANGGFYTRIGNNNLFMIAAHVGHDCVVHNNCIIGHNSGIAGHVEVEDNVIIGGNAGVHQFVRIGTNVMIGGMSGVSLDVPPFTIYTGSRASKIRGLNIVGLKRRGFSASDIKAIKNAYVEIFKDSNFAENSNQLGLKSTNAKVKIIANFLAKKSIKGVCVWDETEEDQ